MSSSPLSLSTCNLFSPKNQKLITKTLFVNVFTNDAYFSSFIDYALNFEIHKNHILLYETVETFLDLVLDSSHVRSLDRFLYNTPPSLAQKRLYIPSKYAKHIQQICLAYLVTDAPLQLDVDQRIMNTAAMKASEPFIPVSIFDELIDTVLWNLYTSIFPGFITINRFSHDLYDTLYSARLAPSLLDDTDDDTDLDDDMQTTVSTDEINRYTSVPLSLNHKTSSLLEKIYDDNSSLYSNIESVDEETLSNDPIHDLISDSEPYTIILQSPKQNPFSHPDPEIVGLDGRSLQRSNSIRFKFFESKHRAGSIDTVLDSESSHSKKMDGRKSKPQKWKSIIKESLEKYFVTPKLFV